MKPVRAALVYDFDGTLARGNMQEHNFMPAVGVVPDDFWRDVAAEARDNDADAILTYMRRMLETARLREIAITRPALRAYGANLPLFDGLDSWFGRMTAHAATSGLLLEHYVVSSGLHEIIEGCSIFPEFKTVFASK